MNISSESTTASETNETEVISPVENASTKLWTSVSPVLLVVGVIGNVLSIFVLSRKSMRRSGASGYLLCLSIADLLVLITGLLRQWLSYTFSVNIEEFHPTLCNVGAWLIYFSLDMSAWILVSVTVERAISVWKPHKVKIICTRKVLIVNILLIMVFLMAVNCHFLFGVTTDDSVGNCECGCISWEYEQFQILIFPWIDLFLFSIGPFFCHVVGNTLIIIGLIKSSRTMARYNLETSGQTETRQHQISSMTVMLLCVNVINLVCTLPISVYFIIKDQVWTSDDDPQNRLVYGCLNLLMYLNNSTNFITYVVSGRRFRGELFAVFRRITLTLGTSFTLSASKSSVTRSQNLASTHTSTFT